MKCYQQHSRHISSSGQVPIQFQVNPSRWSSLHFYSGLQHIFISQMESNILTEGDLYFIIRRNHCVMIWRHWNSFVSHIKGIFKIYLKELDFFVTAVEVCPMPIFRNPYFESILEFLLMMISIYRHWIMRGASQTLLYAVIHIKSNELTRYIYPVLKLYTSCQTGKWVLLFYTAVK